MISYRLLTTTALAALAFPGAHARAQDEAAAPQNQQPEATLPQTIPGLENFSLPPSNDRLRLPQSAPAPTPTPRASPTPTPPPSPARRPATPPPLMIQPLPTPTPGAARPTNREPPPRTTATPTPTPTPAATPETEPQASATPIPAPVITAPSAVPAPAATATPPAGAGDGARGGSLLPLALALLAITAVAGLVWLWLARRRDEPDSDEAAIEPAPAAPPPTEPGERPRLDLAFTPRRAGMNVLSAAVDYELVVRNRGAAEAQGVRIALRLFTAGEHHDAELRQYLDAPVEAPVVAEFDLAPGEAKTLRAIALLPKEAVNVVTVQGRPMFVPLVAINALYHWDGGHGQTAASHVVGIARPGTAKMQPFWLDAPPRMYDGVGEHVHAIALTR